MPASAFTVREADWAADAQSVRVVRHDVFVIEQSVPAELEFDAGDDQHQHVLAIDSSGNPIGTGRLTSSGKIGRMAVLKPWRGHGVGSAILAKLIELATSSDIATLTLSSQVHALPFYRRHGFVEHGDVYLEAGIEHLLMQKKQS